MTPLHYVTYALNKHEQFYDTILSKYAMQQPSQIFKFFSKCRFKTKAINLMLRVKES